jgi:hypothetical protein
MCGHAVVSPRAVQTAAFDRLVIAMASHTPELFGRVRDVNRQLASLGVPDEKILLCASDGNGADSAFRPDPRAQFVRDLAVSFDHFGVSGAAAECGVCFGNFAARISKAFQNRKLYLLDTFDGFQDIDLRLESPEVADSLRIGGALMRDIPTDMVMMKMTDRANVKIIKGRIPETFDDVDERNFAFVNIDVDMYAPTIACLRFFGDRLTKGGVMLVHDYFCYNGFYGGVVKAVREFVKESGFSAVPIGDGYSIALTAAAKDER